ncbi:AfsR/SARP family transcriptional regulator [Actinophytocola sp. KF-1]
MGGDGVDDGGLPVRWSVSDGREDELRFGILGPLEVVRGRSRIEIGAAKLRVFLAALLVRANQPVSLDELAVRLWGDRTPKTARRTIRVHAMRLRRVLGDDGRSAVVRTHTDGYSVEVTRDQLDLLRFRDLRAQAMAAARNGDRELELAFLTEAINLWRDHPLSDVPSDSLQREVASQLEEERLFVVERRLDIDLAVGRAREVVSELVQLTKEHPWHEPFWEQLVVALYRSERLADALDTYQTVQRLFRDELGVEPGERLQRLQQDILSGAGPAGFVPAAEDRSVARSTRSGGDPVLAPAQTQLPPGVRGFVDRPEVAELVTWARDADEAAVPIMIVGGMPGVGKTALPLHVAHRLHERYPDGRLYIDLRGFAPQPPLPVKVALGSLLQSLGVPAGEVPESVEGCAAKYRALLSGRRVLVVLDDAEDAEQVRPLLPGVPGSAVLVTSRMDLRGLAVTNGAERMVLDVLSRERSAELLATFVGEERAAREPAAVEALAELTGHLPLALRIAGAHVAADPAGDVAEHVRFLRERARLAELVVDGDDTVGVRAAFDRSYLRLTAPDQHLFRLLGRMGSQDQTAEDVARFAGLPPAEVRRAMDRLVGTSLVERPALGRYRLHPLLHEYARSLPVNPQDGAGDEMMRMRAGRVVV